MISNIHYKTEYWVIIYESHDSDLAIFIIVFANSSDDARLFGKRLIFQHNNIIRNSNKIYIRDNMNVYHLSSQRGKK